MEKIKPGLLFVMLFLAVEVPAIETWSLDGPSKDYSTVSVRPNATPDGSDALAVHYHFKVMGKSANSLWLKPEPAILISEEVESIDFLVHGDGCRHRLYFQFASSNWKQMLYTRTENDFRTLSHKGWFTYSLNLKTSPHSIWNGNPKVNTVKYPLRLSVIWLDPINRSHLEGDLLIGGILLKYKNGREEKVSFLPKTEKASPPPEHVATPEILFNPLCFGNMAWDGEKNRLQYEAAGVPDGELNGLADFLDIDGNLLERIVFTGKAERGRLRGSIDVPSAVKGYYQLRFRLLQKETLIQEKHLSGGNFSTVPQPAPENARLGMGHWIWDADPEPFFRIMRNMGLRWLRTDAVWPMIEKEEGKTDWRLTDRMYQMARKYGLSLLITVQYVPRWGALEPYHQYGGNPIPEKWSAFLTKLIKRHGDKIAVYEVWNEPNTSYHWSGGAATYAEHLKRSSSLIRRLAPRAKIAHAGLTHHLPSALQFTEELLYRQVGTLFDIFSFHYGNGEYAPKYQNLLEAAGLKKALWNTESGFGKPEEMIRNQLADLAGGTEKSFFFLFTSSADSFTETFVLNFRREPRPVMPMLRFLAEKLGEKSEVERFMATPEVEAFRIRTTGKKECVVLTVPPQSALAVKSNAEKIELANAAGDKSVLHPVGGIAGIPSGRLIYLSADSSLEFIPGIETISIVPAASIIAGNHAPFTVRVKNPTEQVLEGELILRSSRSWKKSLDSRKLILQPGEVRTVEMLLQPDASDADTDFRVDADWCIAGHVAMRQSVRGRVEHPVRIIAAPAISGGSGVHVTLQNRLKHPEKVLLRVAPPAAWQERFSREVALAPLETRRETFRFSPETRSRIAYGKNYLVRISALIRGFDLLREEKMSWVALAPLRERCNWEKRPVEIRTAAKKDFVSDSVLLELWTGPKDFSVDFQWGWHSDALHFRWCVTDDVHCNKELDDRLWNGDCVQFFYNGELFDLALQNGKSKIFSRSRDDDWRKWRVDVQRNGSRTIYNLVIPGDWKIGDHFNFAYCVNDNDEGERRKGWMWGLAPVGDAGKRHLAPDVTLIGEPQLK